MEKKYDRLTQRIGGVTSIKTYTGSWCTPFDGDEIRAVDRLCAIEDKIENGTLIELPCKVGDTAYCCNYGDKGWRILKGYVNEINIDVNGIYLKCDYEYSLSFWHKITNYDVFFNIEEVEKRLKELQNG